MISKYSQLLNPMHVQDVFINVIDFLRLFPR